MEVLALFECANEQVVEVPKVQDNDLQAGTEFHEDSREVDVRYCLRRTVDDLKRCHNISPAGHLAVGHISPERREGDELPASPEKGL